MKSSIPTGVSSDSPTYNMVSNGANSFLDSWQDALTLGKKDDSYDIGAIPNHAIAKGESFMNPYINRAEMRARTLSGIHGLTDPFTPNFKLFIDFSKPYGLFGCSNLAEADDPKYVNSAMAYFRRIEGSTSPHGILLQQFIEQFKIFLKEYDYLILNIENLDELYSIYNKHQYVEETEIKCNIIVREIVTMQLAGLLNLYNNIWFDPVSNVEILPENLRRFDLYILVFSSGYFNSLLYDLEGLENKDDEEGIRKIFPTVNKINKLYESTDLNLPDNIDFNSFVFHMVNAQFDMIESGKKIFSDVTNEMAGEATKNNISITSRFIDVGGRFAQIDGGVNLMTLLALQNRNINSGNMFSDFFNTFASNAVTSIINSGFDIVNSATSKIFDITRNVVSRNSPIGNALYLLTSPEEIAKQLSNAVKVGTNGLIRKYVDTPSNWLQSMVSNNFNENILTDLMNKATGGFFGTNVEGPDKIADINETVKNLPAETHTEPSFKPGYEISRNPVKNVNDNIIWKETIDEYVESSNNNNIELQDNINEQIAESNNPNITVRNNIDEYVESQNKTNIELQKDITEYIESSNKNNIRVEKKIQSYSEYKNNNNVKVQETIDEFIESNNNSNIEYSDSIQGMETKDVEEEIYREGSTRTQKENLLFMKEIFKHERPTVKNTRFK